MYIYPQALYGSLDTITCLGFDVIVGVVCVLRVRGLKSTVSDVALRVLLSNGFEHLLWICKPAVLSLRNVLSVLC